VARNGAHGDHVRRSADTVKRTAGEEGDASKNNPERTKMYVPPLLGPVQDYNMS